VLGAKDEGTIPTTVFHTVLGNQLVATPMKVLLIPGGDAATGQLATMHLQGFTEDEILEALSMDAETAQNLSDTMRLCNNEELRCNRFFVEDAGLDSTALEAKLAEHSARRLGEEDEECPFEVDDEDPGRRLGFGDKKENTATLGDAKKIGGGDRTKLQGGTTPKPTGCRRKQLCKFNKFCRTRNLRKKNADFCR